MFIVRMVDPTMSDTHAAPSTVPAVDRLATYEAPSLVEVGTLRDLTAAGSFIDPT